MDIGASTFFLQSYWNQYHMTDNRIEYNRIQTSLTEIAFEFNLMTELDLQAINREEGNYQSFHVI